LHTAGTRGRRKCRRRLPVSNEWRGRQTGRRWRIRERCSNSRRSVPACCASLGKRRGIIPSTVVTLGWRWQCRRGRVHSARRWGENIWLLRDLRYSGVLGLGRRPRVRIRTIIHRSRRLVWLSRLCSRCSREVGVRSLRCNRVDCRIVWLVSRR